VFKRTLVLVDQPDVAQIVTHQNRIRRSLRQVKRFYEVMECAVVQASSTVKYTKVVVRLSHKGRTRQRLTNRQRSPIHQFCGVKDAGVLKKNPLNVKRHGR